MKKRYVRFTTPVGTALWPHLNEPDTKFDKDGSYSVKLILNKEDTQNIKTKLSAVLEEFVSSGESKSNKKAPMPIKEDTDKDGKPTGDYQIKFKLRAVGQSRGERWEQRPALFDSQGQPCSDLIGNGSKIKVGAEVVPYSTAMAGTGVTLRLKAVQVIELSSVSGGDSFDSWSFSKEEGFTTSGDQKEVQEEIEEGDGPFDF
tara:strand:+ start:2992 stop:3597 length:606 start_codon:yes stop_codon:yes gene_type:complete